MEILTLTPKINKRCSSDSDSFKNKFSATPTPRLRLRRPGSLPYLLSSFQVGSSFPLVVPDKISYGNPGLVAAESKPLSLSRNNDNIGSPKEPRRVLVSIPPKATYS